MTDVIFKLVIQPDGKAILATEGTLAAREAEHIRAAFEAWKAQPDGLLILASTDVIQVREIALNLPDGRA